MIEKYKLTDTAEPLIGITDPPSAAHTAESDKENVDVAAFKKDWLALDHAAHSF
ncbi:hypothetical protein [Sphingobacterium sp.]|uniref:hypothetical protein n=1 Tax=Sphingobacterium sp. TaxID=341027 RepID=UPI002899E53D|nr:hypothetical protein [Sphingobacterium sp.]